MGLNKINKPEALAKTAYRILRRSILTNDLTVGVVYNEKSLANDLGISRTPVREALLELSSKRLVKFLPQKGVIINVFSNKEIDDVFEIRTALEVFSIKKICLSYKTLDISHLTKDLNDQKNAARLKNKLEFMEADRSFHIGFSRLAQNNYLEDMMQDIRDIMHLMGFRALDIEGRIKEVVIEHENILNAIVKGDVSLAKEHMTHHLEVSKKAVKQIYQDENRQT
ncbi:MAG: GntR family transcriptional regulator [Proteobacteria bacterium]|nr:GntR family transcriptional regulator [Pseudomonadota bacterium]MBU1584229.1 GntR family transcriptional regulator [Pseudomonadota bacterium]MBU2629184.1 GntR family transcriptional regulator [Pseudomonadota bacterium]